MFRIILVILALIILNKQLNPNQAIEVNKQGLSQTQLTEVPYYKPEPYHLKYIQDSINQPPYQKAIIYTEYIPLLPFIAGQTLQLSPNNYLIVLNPLSPEQAHTYMHELVHVRQMHQGHLRKEGSTWYWQDTVIDWQTPYNLRPFEEQAESQAIEYELQQGILPTIY